MNDSALLALILSTPAAKAVAIAGTGDESIPGMLTLPMLSQSYMLTTRGVLKTLGTVAGATVMQSLRALVKVGTSPLAPVLAELLPIMDDVSNDGGIDLSLDTGSPTLMQSLVAANLLTSDQAAALVALAHRPDFPESGQVSRVLAPFRTDNHVGQENWTGA